MDDAKEINVRQKQKQFFPKPTAKEEKISTKKDGAGGKKHPRNGFGKIFCQKKSDQKTAAGGAKGPKDRK